MAKSRTKQRRRRSDNRRAAASKFAERRPAVQFMIVGWLLSVLTTLACEAIAILCWASLAVWTGPRIELFAGLVLFAALVMGLLSLLMLAVIWRSHAQRLPTAIVVAAVIIAILPVGLMTVQAFNVE